MVLGKVLTGRKNALAAPLAVKLPHRQLLITTARQDSSPRRDPPMGNQALSLMAPHGSGRRQPVIPISRLETF